MKTLSQKQRGPGLECESRFGVTDVHTNEDFTGVNDVESYEGHGYHTGVERQSRGRAWAFEGDRPGSKPIHLLKHLGQSCSALPEFEFPQLSYVDDSISLTGDISSLE